MILIFQVFKSLFLHSPALIIKVPSRAFVALMSSANFVTNLSAYLMANRTKKSLYPIKGQMVNKGLMMAYTYQDHQLSLHQQRFAMYPFYPDSHHKTRLFPLKKAMCILIFMPHKKCRQFSGIACKF